MSLFVVVVVEATYLHQDIIYPHGSIDLGDTYAQGHEWIAYEAALVDSGRDVLVKYYISKDASRRKVFINPCWNQK